MLTTSVLFTLMIKKNVSLFLGDNLDAVHDITVAYPKNIPQTERHLIMGLFPREIHFHVRRYPVTSLPASSSDLESWCRDRWTEKEARLRDFYSGQPRHFDREGVARVPPCKTELRVGLIKAASLLYWSSFIALCFTGLWLWAPFRLYFLVVVGVYVAQQKLIGGLELLELSCHRYWKSICADVGEKNKALDGKLQWGQGWLDTDIFPPVLIEDTVESVVLACSLQRARGSLQGSRCFMPYKGSSTSCQYARLQQRELELSLLTWGENEECCVLLSVLDPRPSSHIMCPVAFVCFYLYNHCYVACCWYILVRVVSVSYNCLELHCVMKQCCLVFLIQLPCLKTCYYICCPWF